MTDRYASGDLPIVVPGNFDHVVVTQLGKPFRALAPEVTAAAAALQAALNQLVTEKSVYADGVIASMGFEPPVPYAAGIELSSPRQTVEHAGHVYAPLSSALPLTTSGTFETDAFRLVAGVTGSDLAAGPGAAMIGYLLGETGTVLRNLFAKAQEWVSAEDFGAVGDGVTDDTAALNRALSVPGRAVRLMPKTYLCGDLSPANGAHFFAHAAHGYIAHEAASLPRLLMKPGSACLVNITGKRGVSATGVVFDGNNRSAPVISGGSERFTAFACRFINGSRGVGGSVGGGDAYCRVMHLIKCVIATNTWGLVNPIDAFFVACEVANNGINIVGQAGANSNTFVGGRVEWSTSGQNLFLAGSSTSGIDRWMFAGTLFDRGYKESMRLSWLTDSVFAGVVVSRGNASGSAAVAEDCNVSISNCSRLTFAAVAHTRGGNDGGGGLVTPSYPYSFTGTNSDIALVGGSIQPGFAAPLYGAHTVSEFKCIGVSGCPETIRSSLGIQIADGETFRSAGIGAGVPASSTSTLQMTTRLQVGTYDLRVVELEIAVRNASAGFYYAARFLLRIGREAGGATMAAGLLGEVGTPGAIGFGSGTVLNCGLANIAADGSSFDLACANATAGSTLNVRAVLR